MNQLTRFDTAALNRAFLGFDRLFQDMETRYANQANNNYPPYNIERNGDTYTVVLAVAGFDRDEIDISVDQDQLVIKGQKVKTDQAEGTEVVHKGLGFRDFERVFTLSEHMEVRDAEIKNGLLTICIQRVIPEALLPRKIEVKQISA